MNEGFVTWSMFLDYAQIVTMIFMFVEFTKDIPYINNIKTKYYSWMVAFIFIIVSQLHADTFAYWDIILYAMSAIVISLTGNGLSDFNSKVIKNERDIN